MTTLGVGAGPACRYTRQAGPAPTRLSHVAGTHTSPRGHSLIVIPALPPSQLQTTSPARTVRVLVGALRGRRDALGRAAGPPSEWRRLQYDAVHTLVEAQRSSVALHGEITRSDKDQYRRLRLESLELAMATDHLRELIGEIERCITAAERTSN